MKQDAHLKSFIAAIGDEAKKKSDEIINSTEAYIKRELEREARDAQAQAQHIVEKRTKDIRAQAGRALAREQAKVRCEIYSHREELENKVFDKAAKKLTVFSSSPEYENFLRKSVENIRTLFAEADIINIRMREEDMKYSTLIEQAFGKKAVICADENIKIGGIIASNDNSKIIADDTLDERLRGKRKEFHGVRELIIE